MERFILGIELFHVILQTQNLQGGPVHCYKAMSFKFKDCLLAKLSLALERSLFTPPN